MVDNTRSNTFIYTHSSFDLSPTSKWITFYYLKGAVHVTTYPEFISNVSYQLSITIHQIKSFRECVSSVLKKRNFNHELSWRRLLKKEKKKGKMKRQKQLCAKIHFIQTGYWNYSVLYILTLLKVERNLKDTRIFN